MKLVTKTPVTKVPGFLTKEKLIQILNTLPDGTAIWIVAEAKDESDPDMIHTLEGSPAIVAYNATDKRLEIVITDDPKLVNDVNQRMKAH